ncbi:VPLPA-CTERM-specific exosortase XrtD [Roseospira marina]|nr:VPLPA-CTERM-specific exosortase XrtD [Roseospira marina]MBB5087486.1 exosortase D (VPLPA-CTERM-specific) [Roseospira marina]
MVGQDVNSRSDADGRGAGAFVKLGAAALCIVCFGVLFWDGLIYAASAWERDEFSYGYIVPPLALLMIWHALRGMTPPAVSRGGGIGAAIVVFAAVLAVLAKVGGMPTFGYYGFILSLLGLVLILYGAYGLRWLLFPIAYLFFALPLPNTLYIQVSTTMQHISSVLGTDILRAMGYSVFLNGNIIDLGLYQLQVAEACNGLRYLFPLASFAYLVGYIYAGPIWHRVVLFLFTVPITIAINSARIALTGILVNYQGVEAAEGFMHAFEGWVIFVFGLVLLFVVLQILMLISGDRRLFVARLNLDIIIPAPGRVPAPMARATPALIVALVAVVAGVVAFSALPEGARTVPPRKPLATFPLSIDGWSGTERAILPTQLETLQVDDYIVADYENPQVDTPVNLYVAWYDAQDRRATIHSPAVCIPAGGWEITDLSDTTLTPDGMDTPLTVNRSVIVNGTQRQLVYFWFELRHRRLTDELRIKLANVWDALTLGRTDGALVRVITPIRQSEDPEDADARLRAFLGDALPLLDAYVPN